MVQLTGEELIVEGLVNNVDVKFVVDTGSAITIISSRKYYELKTLT